jgi:hypothetical protein
MVLTHPLILLFLSDRFEETCRIESLPCVHGILGEALNRMDIPEDEMDMIFEQIHSFEELLEIGYLTQEELPNFLRGVSPFFAANPNQDS